MIPRNTDDRNDSTTTLSAEEWLALPHTRTWLQLIEAGDVPEFMFTGRASTTAGPRWDPVGKAMNLGAVWTRWPSTDDCALSIACPTCRAARGEPCVIRSKHRHWHAPRVRRPARAHNRDLGRAPWPEDRIPGRSYSSIPTR